MSINLKDYLKRKRTTLENFIQKNNINDYQQILDYCQRRGCDPISREAFELLVPPPVLQEKVVEPKIEAKESAADEEKTSKPKRRSRKRVSRPAQSSQEEGTSDQPVEDA